MNEGRKSDLGSTLRTRDRDWAAFGIAPRVDYSQSPLANYGQLSRPGIYSPDNVTHRGKEWRDIVVHDTLSANGFQVETRSAAGIPDGYKHIDLLINDDLWEVKSPGNTLPGHSRPKDPLSFIKENLKKASSQFRHQYDPISDGPLSYGGNNRVVFNMTYRDVEIDEVFLSRLRSEADRQRIDELILITRGEEWGIGELYRVK